MPEAPNQTYWLL